MRHVAPVRKKLGVRTIFNLLGPLTNPANVTRHMVGVYALEWLGPMAEVLKLLGSGTAWLVHGHDGMDEITTTTETDVVELRTGCIRHFTLSPEMLKLPRVGLNDLRGGDGFFNAAAMMALFKGSNGPYRDIVLFNAAAALIVAGKAADLQQGRDLAAQALTGGAAMTTLETLIKLTNGKPV
jgi:anthranilate phosphoribosyltransferase